MIGGNLSIYYSVRNTSHRQRDHSSFVYADLDRRKSGGEIR
jgi:hypothetical protein